MAVAEAAREAFTHSFVIAEGIGVALLLVAAGAFTLLQRRSGKHGAVSPASSLNEDAGSFSMETGAPGEPAGAGELQRDPADESQIWRVKVRSGGAPQKRPLGETAARARCFHLRLGGRPVAMR
jgi:hypothetical protein